MSTTPTATSPYPVFGTDVHLREGLEQPTHFADALGHLPLEDHAKIIDANLARPVIA